MSAVSTPNDSPAQTPIQPLHNPSQAAHVVVPQAPLGNATNGVPGQGLGMGAKALLAKKLAKAHNPTYVSPTDNMLTPCTQKISAAKKKHFNKGAKPMPSLFAQHETAESEQNSTSEPESSPKDNKMDDDENPF